jgi:hypothetical protein
LITSSARALPDRGRGLAGPGKIHGVATRRNDFVTRIVAQQIAAKLAGRADQQDLHGSGA